MNFDNLNPFIRYASLHNFYNHFKKDRVCYDCRLFLVTQGDGTLTANGENFNLSDNTLIYFPPNTHYSFNFKNSSIKLYVLNFDLIDQYSTLVKSIGTADESNFDPNKILPYDILDELKNPIVKNNFLHGVDNVIKCVQLFLDKPIHYKSFASANLKIALLQLLKEHSGESNEFKLVESVKEYVKNNYHRPELTNQLIASTFNYHPYHLSRLMKAHTNKTLHNYLIDFRIGMAKYFLTTTTLNVTEISDKIGFSNYAYFIKIFRQKTGLSPLQYKKAKINVGL